MHRRLLAAVAVPALLVTACQGNSSEKGSSTETTVKVAHVPSTLFAPLYVAEAKGYFKEQGLKVDLQKVQAGQDAVPLAGTGKVDAVVAGFSAGLFNAIAQGLNVKVAASMGASPGTSPAPTALEVAQRLLDSKQVKTSADLRGRKIAVPGGAGGAGAYQLATILREAGLALKDVKIVAVQMPDMRSALASGGVDAALAAAPFTTAMEERGEAGPVAVPPRGTTASGVVLNGAFAQKPAADKFLTALRKGAADLQGTGATSDRTLNILAEATGQTLEVLRKTPPYQWDPALAPDTAQLAAQQEAYREAGLLNGAASD
ncbi:ABC transporter substrate-binding protein [Streptomyces virginiae]